MGKMFSVFTLIFPVDIKLRFNGRGPISKDMPLRKDDKMTMIFHAKFILLKENENKKSVSKLNKLQNES